MFSKQSTQIITLKKNNKNKKKMKKTLNLKQLKLFIQKFIDPIQTHRFYGDFVIPDKLWKFDEDGLYSFLLYRDYKKIRQVHIRDNGIILEMEDYNENSISCLGLIQTRLMSLGNKNARELANFLEVYEHIFTKTKETTENKEIIEKSPKPLNAPLNYEESLQWMDKVFNEYQDDALFIRGNRFFGSDFRTKYLAYNKKMLDWLTKQTNYFSSTFIEDCLKIFKFKNFEDFTNIIKSSVLKQSFPKFLNTIAGVLTINVEVVKHFIMNEKMFFHLIVYPKKEHDEKFLKQIRKIQGYEEEKLKLINQNDSLNYSDLIKLYYLKR